jgi:hypothetical protein
MSPTSDTRTARRWPLKAAGAFGAALLAWLVPFAGPKLFSGADRAVRGPRAPLSVAVAKDPARFTSRAFASYGAPTFLYHGPVAKLGAPPDAGELSERHEYDRWAWAHAHGAIDATSSLVRLKISGTTTAPVILDDLRVEVTQRRRPPDAWWIGYLGLGAAQGVRYFDVDLDKRSPAVKYVGRRDPLPLRVSETDVEVVDILASTLRCDCKWNIKVDWVAGTQQGTLTIDDHGRPFETSAFRERAGGDPRRAIAWWKGRWMGIGPTGIPQPLRG